MVALAVQLFASSSFAQNAIRLLYIRAEFSNALMGISDTVWQQRLNAINGYAQGVFIANSYGAINGFQATLTPVLLLPEPSTSYEGWDNIWNLANAMRLAATTAGFDPSQFDHVVLSYPGVLNQPFGGLGTPGTVWLPGSDPWGPGFAHEMGHALGVGHASAIEGPNVTYPGEHREGRDGLFIMGSDDPQPGDLINLYMRYQMGFLNSSFLDDVVANSVKRIYAFDTALLPASSTNKLAAVFQYDGKEFWVTFAPTLTTLYPNYGGAVWDHGVLVHEVSGSITRILDFTPGSRGDMQSDTADWWDTRDGALVVGTTYTFPISNFSVRPLRTGVSAQGRRWIDVAFVVVPQGDVDTDSIDNSIDNCRTTANATQLDSDDDGFGNICDGDLNNSGLTTAVDFTLLRSVLNQTATSSSLAAAADLNGSGLVTSADFTLLRARLNTVPGPSGLHP